MWAWGRVGVGYQVKGGREGVKGKSESSPRKGRNNNANYRRGKEGVGGAFKAQGYCCYK